MRKPRAASAGLGASVPPLHLSLVAKLDREPSADERLVRAFFDGDATAAVQIWDKYSGMVSRSLCRLLGTTHEVEDITQEVFLRVFDKLDGIEDPNTLRAFIFSITLRTTRWQRRRRWIRRRIYSAPTESLPMAITACEDFEARQAVARFARLLDTLSDASRAAFILHHIEGFSLKEVSDAMRISLGTLKRRLSHAVAKVHLLARRDPALMGYLSSSARKIRDEP